MTNEELEIEKRLEGIAPGTPIWVVIRDTTDHQPYKVAEYIYLARCQDALILSMLPVDCHTIDSLIDYHLGECEGGYETYLMMIRTSDCYKDEEDARMQLPQDEDIW